MSHSAKLRRLAARCQALAAALEAGPAPASRSVPSVEHAVSSVEGQVLLLEQLVGPLPEPPRGRMLVDVSTGRTGRRRF